MNMQRRRWVLDRRTFLRGTGAAIALPWLEAMGVYSTSYSKAGELAASEIPGRAVFTCWGLGMNPFTATPEQVGLDYQLPESVKPLNRSARRPLSSPVCMRSPAATSPLTVSSRAWTHTRGSTAFLATR